MSTFHRKPARLLLVLPLVVGLGACGGDSPEGEAETPEESATTAPAPEQNAGPDIWLADLTWNDGLPSFSNLRNATDRPGYDNQPFFFPDGSLHYTREQDGQTDTWRLDPATGESTRVTTTEARGEYSPTATPDGLGFTAIGQEEDGTQLLWRYGLDGAEVAPVFASVEPVGYHAWVDDEEIVMFVLGDPATLQSGRVGSDGATLVVEGIGRSLNAVPGRNAVTFPKTLGGGESEIWWYEDGEARRLAEARDGSQDHTWAEGWILQGQGHRLYALDPENPEAGWTMIYELPDPRIEISRMSVSADGGMIALVGEVRSGAED